LKKKQQVAKAAAKDEDSSGSESEEEDIKRPSRTAVANTRVRVAAVKSIKRETVESSSCSTEKSWGKKKPVKSRSRSVVTKKNERKQESSSSSSSESNKKIGKKVISKTNVKSKQI
jgi:hypothetical protein